MATCGICSIRLAITCPAKRLNSMNFGETGNSSRDDATTPSSSSSVRLMLMKKAGISVALALTTFGRSMSRGNELIARSIFSLVSMNR